MIDRVSVRVASRPELIRRFGSHSFLQTTLKLTSTMEANHPKTAEEMYEELAGIEEGGSIYTLRRVEPFHIEYIERVSRSSKTDPEESKNRMRIYLSTKRGKEYRIDIDCSEGRCAMEHIRNEEWVTYSNDLSGFRYRSPNHPEQGEDLPHDMD